MRLPALLSATLICLSGGLTETSFAADDILRRQEVRPLPGRLDSVLMVNDNNPELIKDDGILLSTFPSTDGAGLDVELKGRFDLFSHHVYAGDDDSLESTLWLAVLAAPLGEHPVDLKLLEGSTSLSQATQPGQTAAPFLPLPTLIRETSDVIAAGPGSRVAGDLLKRRRATEPAQLRARRSGHPGRQGPQPDSPTGEALD